jgi:hypothetical protein
LIDPMPVDWRRELGDRALLALVVLLLLWWRLLFVGYGVDLDTDAYGHHVIARHLADHPADVGANWVWLPLFHYLQAIAVGMGATLRTVRWANAVISAWIPLLYYEYLNAKAPNERVSPLLSSLLLALSPIAMQQGTTGQMEPLFTLLLFVTIVLVDAEKWVATSVVVSFAVMFRYEAWAIPPALAVMHFLERRRPTLGRKKPPPLPGMSRNPTWLADRRWMLPIVVPITFIVFWSIVRWPVDGSLFWYLRATRTFAVDAQHATFHLGGLFYYPIVVPWQCVGWPLLFAPFGIVRAWRNAGPAFVILHLAVLGFLEATWLTHGSLGLYRHFVPVVALYAVFVAEGIVLVGSFLQSKLNVRVGPKARKLPREAVVAFVGFVAMLITFLQLRSWMNDWEDKTIHVWPDRRAIALSMRRDIPIKARIFCDEATLEIMSGLERHRFDRGPLDAPATQNTLFSAAKRDGEAWVASWSGKCQGLRGVAELMLPNPPPAEDVSTPVLLRVTTEDLQP